MRKYQALEDYLAKLDRSKAHSMSFQQIEAILGSGLPKSALQYQAWWANQRGSGHVQAQAWLNAKFHVRELDLKTRRVTFTPVDVPRAPTRALPPAGDRPLTIAQAKRGVALHFGVSPEDVEITVRG